MTEKEIVEKLGRLVIAAKEAEARMHGFAEKLDNLVETSPDVQAYIHATKGHEQAVKDLREARTDIGYWTTRPRDQ